MDDFACRAAEDRRAFIDEAAARRDLTTTIIEKDFWVCWTLRRLARSGELGEQITFKGGTSLSKVYGIIERFSEDIDLTISRSAPLLADALSPMEAGISGKERGRRTDKLKAAAQGYVRDVVLPALEREIAKALGTAEGWSLSIDPDDKERQTLLFAYPRTSGNGAGDDKGFADESAYVKPRIKLEFGARGDIEPFELLPLSPYLAEEFPDEMPDSATDVRTLAIERTFWEKITILHALHHNAKLRDGMSRHYYDVFALDRAGITKRALALPELLTAVVANKSLMFPDSSASYGTAIPGQLQISPTEAMLPDLHRDYLAMSEMFMTPPPGFEDLMRSLAKIEAALNEAA